MRLRNFDALTAPALLLLSLLVPSAALSNSPCKEGFGQKKKELAPGVVIIKQQCEKPIYKAIIIKVDLNKKNLAFYVTPYKKRRVPTSKFAEYSGAIVAINGGFWENQGGFTVSEGSKWPKHGDTDTSTVIGFGGYVDGKRKVEIRPTREVLEKPPAWMEHALTGIPMALEKGKPIKYSDNNVWKYRHPRSAVGLNEEKDTFYMVVVDGRQDGWSWGLKTHQLGELFKQLGAYNALNLDGGGSSTMVIPSLGGVVNSPCPRKGDERKVPNHLALVDTGKSSDKAAIQSFFAFLFGPRLFM